MANNNLESIAQFYSREALVLLFGMTPTLGAVNRQYDSMVAEYGDTVKAFRPQRMTIERDASSEDYTPTDVALDKVEVKLNQLFKKSILLRDKELSLSALDLRRTHFVPAIQSIAEGVERALTGHVWDFMNEGTPRLRAGKIGGMTSANSSDFILEAQEILHTNLAPMGPKTAIVHETALTYLRKNSLFTSAEQRGSAMPLETGEIGRVWNTDIRLSQYVPYAYLPTASTQDSATGAAYSAGETGSLTVTDPGTDWTVGEFAVIAENGQPTWITAATLGTAITLNEALKYDVTNGATIKHYLKCTNEAVARSAGYDGLMTFTHASGKPLQRGQVIAFGTTTGTRHTYTIIEAIEASATTTSVLLSRPLDSDVASGADAFPGPAGGAFNVVLDPNALTFVSRPLASVQAGEGAVSVVQSYRGVALRVTAGYRIEKGGYQFNFDLLCGIKTLNSGLAVPLLS